MNLPEQFWTERPVLAHIRQAAQAQMASPEAVLANCIARTATLVPPSFRLPAVIGAEAPWTSSAASWLTPRVVRASATAWPADWSPSRTTTR